MISNLEGLVARLVLITSCAGEQGCLITDLLGSILALLAVSDNEPTRDEIFRLLENRTSTVYRATAVIWKWVSGRKDISIGQDRKFNGFTLDEILWRARESTPVLPVTDQSASGANSQRQGDLRAYVSDDTMWESLTGHGVDYRRIPRSEWILLQGIASTTSSGILQGDLGRLVGQDKRSVPKRTSCLVEKGYITKRTTLVRGTKTSKLWLKLLAPSTPEEPGDRNDDETDITLSRHYLAENLEPVPWHTRWTGDSIDYRALATTIMATCKEWNVMRLQDLKSKLGVLGMTWQMKVVSKICRFLNARGSIQYVAAKLNNRIFKDCVRFKRDMSTRDWSIFLATGKRATKTSKMSSYENGEAETISSAMRRGQYSGTPSCLTWTLYIPITSLVATAIQQSGIDGLTNPQLCTSTIGPSFTRYLAGLTASISSENIQPDNVKHLAVQSERGRPGKSSSLYWYYMTNLGARQSDVSSGTSGSEVKSTSKAKQSIPNELYNFARLVDEKKRSRQRISLSELCRRGLSQQKRRGRPRKIKTEDQIIQNQAPPDAASLTTEAHRISTSAQRQNLLRRRHSKQSISSEHKELEKPDDQTTSSEDLRPTEIIDHDEVTAKAAEIQPSTRTRGRPKIMGSGRGGRTPLAFSAMDSDNRQFKCEKCCGTWKNDLGLKYHLEKSQTPCNPSHKPQLLTPAKRRSGFAAKNHIKKKTVKSIKEADSDTTGFLADGEGRQATMAADKASRWRADEVELLSHRNIIPMTKSARRKQLRLSKPRTRLSDDVTFLSGQAKLLSTAGGLPPRQVDPFAKPARQYTEKYQIHEVSEATSLLKSLYDPQEVIGGALESHSYISSGSASTALRNTGHLEKVGSKSLLGQAIMDIITEILREHSGALPAGQSLEILVSTKWKSLHPKEEAPDGVSIKSSMQKLIRDKKVLDQWHAFRALDGKIAKCQIITLPSVPAFAPETRSLVEKIRQLYPAQILPHQLPRASEIPDYDRNPEQEQEIGPESTGRSEIKIGGRGRRSLAAGVAILDAPVYAAKIAARRTSDLEEASNISHKRRRRMERSTGWSDEPLRHGLWPWTSHSPPPNDIEPLLFFSSAGISLDILFSNPGREGRDILSGHLSSWLYNKSTSYFLECLARTMQRQGWIPHSNWFSWASCYRELPLGLHAPFLGLSEFDYFVGKLKLCLDVEAEMGEDVSLSAYPHTIFLNLIGGDTGKNFKIPPIQWSRRHVRQDKTQKSAIKADDDELGLSSTSRDDEGAETPSSIVSRPCLLAPAVIVGISPMPPKQVVLASRNLTSLPRHKSQYNSIADSSSSFDVDQLEMAFIVIRSLLGGVDKDIDWGLLVHLFPTIGLSSLRRFWTKIRKERASFLSKATQNFQEHLVLAVHKDEISIPDYDRPLDYDWEGLIQWAMRRPNQEQLQLPSSRDAFRHDFKLEDSNKGTEDCRERFFHPQSSVYSRFEAVTLQPGTLSVMETRQTYGAQPLPNTIDIARSWIRSLCCTSETEYTAQDVKERFSSLSQDTLQHNNAILKVAIDQLTRERVICRSKRTPLGGRPYRLHEGYTSVLAKIAHRQKYLDAVSFKTDIDKAFRQSRSMMVPYTLSDGAVMALTNLIAAERVRVRTATVPNIPFGFEPGNYESRKYPKSYYHLDLVVEPTASYVFNDGVQVLLSVQRSGPPKQGWGREIPQWIDFFGKLNKQRWADILGAFLFALSTRGAMCIAGICDALSPILEPFEAQIIIEWGFKTGILAREAVCGDIRLGEWWWLVAQGR